MKSSDSCSTPMFALPNCNISLQTRGRSARCVLGLCFKHVCSDAVSRYLNWRSNKLNTCRHVRNENFPSRSSAAQGRRAVVAVCGTELSVTAQVSVCSWPQCSTVGEHRWYVHGLLLVLHAVRGQMLDVCWRILASLTLVTALFI